MIWLLNHWKTLEGQIFIDFIVEHRIDVEDEISYVTCTSWKLYFDGYTSSHWTTFASTIKPNEALLFGLEILQSMEVKHVEAFGDSLLVVQQVADVLFCSGLVAVLEEMCNFVVDYIFL